MTQKDGAHHHTPSAKDIVQVMDVLRKFDRQHPLALFMSSRGFPPWKGCKIVVPQSWEAELFNAPRYVVFSALVTEPIMMNPEIITS